MRLAFFDTETGGLNDTENALLSIGAVCGESQFEGYIQPDPRLKIDDEAAKVNGWPYAFADKEKYSEKEIMEAFLGWLATNGVTHYVAHNVAFDHGFVSQAAKRSGIWKRNCLPRALCTQSMAHALKNLGMLNCTSLSLDSVVKTLGIQSNRNSKHDALEDAILCEQVYNAMLRIGAPQQTQQQTPPKRVGLAWGRLSR